jgi:hypothetical protein
LAWGFAEVLDGELCSGDSDLGEQSGRGGIVCGHGEGVAAADGWAVVPCCSGRVYGPGAVCVHGAAVPLHRNAPDGPGLIKKTLQTAFGVGFSLAGAARGRDLDEFIPGRGAEFRSISPSSSWPSSSDSATSTLAPSAPDRAAANNARRGDVHRISTPHAFSAPRKMAHA